MVDAAILDSHVRSADGTPIAVWRYPTPTAAVDTTGPIRTPVLLVHGTTADHTTFRAAGPRLAASRLTFALDRRGREASGDTLPYAIEREFEDVAAIADALTSAAGAPIAVVGHSLGGRCVMGGALRTSSIRRVVSYEGAVPPGVGESRPGLVERLEHLEAADEREELLRVFLTEVVEMTPAEWEAFRTSPVWPARLAAAGTIVRELRAGDEEASAWSGYSSLEVPVLQLVGSESASFFRIGAELLDARLRDGRIAAIDGARHAAHHTHVDRFVALVEAFVDEDMGPAEERPRSRPTRGEPDYHREHD